MKKFGIVCWFILKCTLVGFGGGNALMPIIKREAVERHAWLDEVEFDNLVIVTNMIPGPSVIEALGFIAMKILGKWWGTLATLLAILPHLFIPFSLYLIGNAYLPYEWLYALNVAITPVIVGILIIFAWRYIKKAKKELAWPLGLGLFLFTLGFNLFIPSPWNIPAFIMIAIILLVVIVDLIQKHRQKSKGQD